MEKQYEMGMYGGSFEPLTMGHVKCILEAASMCNRLNVIICWSKKDKIDKRIKYRWIHNITKHIFDEKGPKVKIFMVEDNSAKLTNEKTDLSSDEMSDWYLGKKNIMESVFPNSIGEEYFDVVFCGVDYRENKIFEKLYPESDVIYLDYDRNNISSTRIRKNPYKNWDMIPDIVKPYYVKKVCLMGGESVGKSTLCKNLAIAFNTNLIEEEGRDVCEEAGTEDTMILEDFEKIMLKHKWNELQAVKSSNKLLFVDTEVLTTKWFMNFLCEDESEKKKFDSLADAIARLNKFDLVIFLEPDGVPFVQDGTRNENIEADRKNLSNQIKKLMDKYNIIYHVISGSYSERFKKSYELSAELIK